MIPDNETSRRRLAANCLLAIGFVLFMTVVR